MSSPFNVPGAYPSSTTMTDSGPPPSTEASRGSTNPFSPSYSGFSNDPGSHRPSTNSSRQGRQAQTNSRSAPSQANTTLNPTTATAFHDFGSFFRDAHNVTIHSAREDDPVRFNGRPVLRSATLGVGVPSDRPTTGRSSSGNNSPFRNDLGTYTTTGNSTPSNNPFINNQFVKTEDAGSWDGARRARSWSSGGERDGGHPPQGNRYDAQGSRDTGPRVRNYACMNTKPVYGNLTQTSYVVVPNDYPVEESQWEEEYYFAQEYRPPPPPPPPPPHPRPWPRPNHRPHGSAYFAESGGRPGLTLNNYGNMNTGDVSRGYITQSVQYQHQWQGF